VGKRGHYESREFFFFSMEKEMKIINWEQDFFIHHRILSAVKTVECISDRMSYIVLRGCWFNIMVECACPN